MSWRSHGGGPTSDERPRSGTNCGTNAILGRIRNDILVGGNNANRYGVYEEQILAKTAHPDKFDSNDFFFSTLAGRTDALYHVWNGVAATDLKTTATVSTGVPTNPAPSALLNVDPLVNATFHLADTSPMINMGTLVVAAAADFDGQNRPQGGSVDIGPDEAK